MAPYGNLSVAVLAVVLTVAPILPRRRPAGSGAQRTGDRRRGDHVRAGVRVDRTDPGGPWHPAVLSEDIRAADRSPISGRSPSNSFYGFFDNRLSTSAAAMAFYTMFALGPIMIFSIAIAEPFVGKMIAQQAIFDALGTIVEPEHLKGIQRYASEDLFRGGGIAALIGVGVLLYTGSRVFVELDDSINVIWRGAVTRKIHPVLADPQVARAGAGADGRARPAADLRHRQQRGALGLRRRPAGLPDPGRVDRPRHLGLHPLRHPDRLLHGDLQVAAGHLRAVEVRADQRRGELRCCSPPATAPWSITSRSPTSPRRSAPRRASPPSWCGCTGPLSRS